MDAKIPGPEQRRKHRRILPLNAISFSAVVDHSGEKPVACFEALLTEQFRQRGTQTVYTQPAVFDLNDESEMALLARIKGHYAAHGFVVSDPDPGDGTVSVRYYTTGGPPSEASSEAVA